MTSEQLLQDLRNSITFARDRSRTDNPIHWGRVSELLKEATAFGCRAEAEEITRTVGIKKDSRSRVHSTFNNGSVIKPGLKQACYVKSNES